MRLQALPRETIPGFDLDLEDALSLHELCVHHIDIGLVVPETTLEIPLRPPLPKHCLDQDRRASIPSEPGGLLAASSGLIWEDVPSLKVGFRDRCSLVGERYCRGKFPTAREIEIELDDPLEFRSVLVTAVTPRQRVASKIQRGANSRSTAHPPPISSNTWGIPARKEENSWQVFTGISPSRRRVDGSASARRKASAELSWKLIFEEHRRKAPTNRLP